MSPRDPLCPPPLSTPLLLSHVTVCDAMVTATVRGGACDLCLTNGSFIIPSATSMSPVFIALYFKLNPQQHPSIMVAHDL